MGSSVLAAKVRGGFGPWIRMTWAQLSEFWRSQKKVRSLEVQETAGLGERRFVAVLRFERQRFLIGGSAGSITLLAELPEEERSGNKQE
jgi:flagellar biogenesis protein FliO